VVISTIAQRPGGPARNRVTRVSITSEPVSGASSASPAERTTLAEEFAATDVDLRDPSAAAAVVDLVTAVHELLTRP
jgi:hypothetical protein